MVQESQGDRCQLQGCPAWCQVSVEFIHNGFISSGTIYKYHMLFGVIVDIGYPRTGIIPEASDEGVTQVQRWLKFIITLTYTCYLLYYNDCLVVGLSVSDYFDKFWQTMNFNTHDHYQALI